MEDMEVRRRKILVVFPLLCDLFQPNGLHVVSRFSHFVLVSTIAYFINTLHFVHPYSGASLFYSPSPLFFLASV